MRNLMVKPEEKAAAAESLLRVFQSWFGPTHHYSLAVEKKIRSPGRRRSPNWAEMAAEVRHLVEDLEQGWTLNHDEEVRTRTHNSLLDLASGLVEQGDNEKMAAVMVCGAVLENHLRNLCEKHGVTPTGSRGKPPGIDGYNNALYKLEGGPYKKAQMGIVQGWAKMRNAAAHHNEDDFEPAQAESMIQAVAAFIEQHPA
jgi:hypothetical protein